MAHAQATPPLRPGQRLAHEVCRDLALRPPLALPSQALIEALARQRSWMVLVRSATPAESLRMSRAGFTGAIVPLQPDVWQIVVHGEARPTYREYLILTLLAPLLQGQVPPEGGWVRGELVPHPDEWIGEDFARTLLTDL